MSDTTRPDRIRVIADTTAGPHRTDSDDILWWLPILGPTASALAFIFARHAAQGQMCWPTDDLARMVGLSGNRSRLWVSLERLHRFHVTTFVSTDTLTVRLWLPALTERQLSRLPEALAIAYRSSASGEATR
jgi:hypothetical protein